MIRVSGGSLGFAGYTIIETLIFLGVSGLLAVSALLLVGAQQGRTEFSQSVREMELILQDVMNDVSTGNFPSPGNIKCVDTGGTPTFPLNGSAAQGTNKGCILIGRVIQFRPSSVKTNYRLFSVAGAKGDINSLTAKLHDANPRLVTLGDGTLSATTTRIPYGIQVASVSIPGGCNPYAIGFFTDFATNSGIDLNSSARSVDVVPLCGVGVNADDTQVGNQVKLAGEPAAIAVTNPASGIQICLTDGGQRRGLITIGGSGRQFTTKSEIAGSTLCT